MEFACLDMEGEGCSLQDILEALGTCTQETTYITYNVHEIICDFADSAIPLFQSNECRLPLAGMTTYK